MGIQAYLLAFKRQPTQAWLFCTLTVGLGTLACGDSTTLADAAMGQSNLSAVSDTLAVSPNVNGRKLDRVGMELSYYPAGSNTSLYLRRTGVTHVRSFIRGLASGTDLRDFIGSTRWGNDVRNQPVDSRSAFVAAAADLSSDPRGSWTNPVKWSALTEQLLERNQGLTATLKYFLPELKKMNITLLSNLSLSPPNVFTLRTFDKSASSYWKERWELYKFMYAVGRILMAEGQTEFEAQNEPDLVLKTADRRQDALDRGQITALAIRQAASDAGLASAVTMVGPTTARSSSPLPNDSMLTDAAEQNGQRFAGGAPAGWKNFDAFSYHRYNASGSLMGDVAKSADSALRKNGLTLPLFVTEFAAKTAAAYDKGSDSADTPARATRLMEQTVVNARNTEGFYAFTFAMRSFPGSQSGVTKNGLHFVDIKSPLHNVGHTTRGAESYRLFAAHFAGRRLDSVDVKARTGITYLATSSASSTYLLVVNYGGARLKVAADLGKLDVRSGARGVLDSVSSSRHGGVAALPVAGSGSRVLFEVPGFSTSLLTMPRGAPPPSTEVYFAHANAVKAGSNASKVYLDEEVLPVVLDARGAHSNTSAVILPMPPQVSATAFATVLKMTVKNSSSQEAKLHVYLFPAGQVAAASLSWTSSQMLSALKDGSKVDAVSKNFVKYGDALGPQMVGTLRVAKSVTNQDYCLNLTQAIGNAGGGGSLLVVREFLADPANKQTSHIGDDLANTAVNFYGVGAANKAQRPRLQLLSR